MLYSQQEMSFTRDTCYRNPSLAAHTCSAKARASSALCSPRSACFSASPAAAERWCPSREAAAATSPCITGQPPLQAAQCTLNIHAVFTRRTGLTQHEGRRL